MTRRAVPATAAIVSLITLACAAIPGLAPRATPTPTPAVLADCFWSVEAFAWNDADGDGTRDDGEPPLAGVAVRFSESFLSGETTDDDGTAHLTGMTTGACLPDLVINVIATAPEGYTATTATTLEYGTRQGRYEFGFKPSS
jgi:hypothetical protein